MLEQMNFSHHRSARASRWIPPRFRTASVLIALGLAGFGDPATAGAVAGDLVSIGPVTAGVRTATFNVTLTEEIDWSDHQMWLNGVEISDVVAAGDGVVELNMLEHPLRYGTNRLKAKAVLRGPDGSPERVEIDLLSFTTDLPSFDVSPRSPLSVNTRVAPENPDDIGSFQVRIGEFAPGDACTRPNCFQPPINLDNCPFGSLLWFVILDRADLSEVGNYAYHSCGRQIGDVVWDKLNNNDPDHPEDQTNNIVIVNKLFEEVEATGWPSDEMSLLAERLNVSQRIALTQEVWSIISAPGAGGIGFEHYSAKSGDQQRAADGTAAANLRGGLATASDSQDSDQANYDFVQTDYAIYDTRASEKIDDQPGTPARCPTAARTNAIFVHDTCYPAQQLAQSEGGFQVVVVDRKSLAQISNQTYITQQNDAATAWANVRTLTADLKRVGEGQLVFVASLGDEPLIGAEPGNSAEENWVAGLAFALERVGATPETIVGTADDPTASGHITGLAGEPGTYSLVGTFLTSAADLPESSSVIHPTLHSTDDNGQVSTVQNPGRLRGALGRGRLNRLYVPLGHQMVSVGDMNLADIVGQTSEDWPVPVSIEQSLAYDFILSQFENVCKIRFSNFTRDLRDNYIYVNRLPDFQTCINNPQVRFEGGHGFSVDDYDVVHNQLQTEIDYLNDDLGTMHGYTVDAINDGKINAGLEIGHVIDEGFKDDERVDNKTSSILVIVGDVVKGIGAILSAADVPGAGAVTGVINVGLNIAANLTRKKYGGSFTFERTVDTIAHDQAQVVEDFSEIVNGFDLQITLISGDWGKLNRFHDAWVNRWKFTSDDFDTDLPTSLALAYQRHVAEQVTTQFYAALQRGMLSMDQFHEWGINWNFGEDFNFDTSWDPQTLQTRRPDDRVDVILIKTAPC